MHDAVPERKTRNSHIEDWMLDLLDEDRAVQNLDTTRVTDRIHWLYRSALVRPN